MFGPMKKGNNSVSLEETIQEYMEYVDKRRSDEVYKHNRCCEDCRERGCGRLYVADGCWKIHYPICMFTTTSDMRGLDQFLPNVCTRAPANVKAFCIEHSAVLDRSGIPTLLRPFLNFLQLVGQAVGWAGSCSGGRLIGWVGGGQTLYPSRILGQCPKFG